MAVFRVTYHTSGGPFSRDVEAASIEEAAESAEKATKAAQVRYSVKDMLILLDSSKIAAVTVELVKGTSLTSREEASISILGGLRR